MQEAGSLKDGVDLHAHWFGRDLRVADRMQDDRWPTLTVDSSERGRLMLGRTPFRDVRSSLWDVRRRVADLDAAGVRHQVISPVPVTLATWADRDRAIHYAKAASASIGAAAADSGGRLLGLGAVPLPHVRESVEALQGLMTGPQPMLGVEISSRIGALELDNPQLLPFFEAAESLGALVMVHPGDGGSGTVRRGGQPYDFGLGMLTDTALAAAALVFGGVMDRFPRLRVVLAHGCGGFAWSYPRMRLGANVFQGIDTARLDDLVRRLWVDSLVLDPEHLRLLVHRFGEDRVVLGTDHPFFPGVTQQARAFLSEAEETGALRHGAAHRVFSSNGAVLTGLGVEAT